MQAAELGSLKDLHLPFETWLSPPQGETTIYKAMFRCMYNVGMRVRANSMSRMRGVESSLWSPAHARGDHPGTRRGIGAHPNHSSADDGAHVDAPCQGALRLAHVGSRSCRCAVATGPGQAHPIFEHTAENVAFRRAKGKFILKTNIDNILSPDTAAWRAPGHFCIVQTVCF